MLLRKKYWAVIALLLALVFTSALPLKQQGYSKEIPLNFQLQDSTIQIIL